MDKPEMSDEATGIETVAAARLDDEDATQMDVVVAETPRTPTAYSEDAELPSLVEYSRTVSKRRVVALATGILAAGCAIAGGIVAWDASHSVTRSSQTLPPTANPLGPDNPHDEEFIERMRDFNVPVPDWRYTVNQAQSICATLDHDNAPPGNYTIETMKGTVKLIEPAWNEAQVHYFVLGTLDSYCPKYRIPTEAELSQMAPDDRYMALLGNRLGFKNDDHRQSFIDNGHKVCSQLMAGVTTDQAIDNIQMEHIPYGMTQRDAAAQFVGIAASVYCPQYGH